MERYTDPRIDRLVYDLCKEIDHWKAEAKHWEKEYKELMQESIQRTNQSIKDSENMIGGLLLVTLNSHDDENGNLVISRDGRKEIVEHINHTQP